MSGRVSGSLAKAEGSTPPAPLLDGAGSAFAGLYSETDRLLTTYSGALYRVRNGTTDVETDIGYLTATNRDDRAALVTACAGASGFLVTRYDQSGNGRNWTQATKPAQAKIYDSVTGPVLIGDALCALYDDVDDTMGRADGFGLAAAPAISVACIYKSADATNPLPFRIGTAAVSRDCLQQFAAASTQLTLNIDGASRTFTCSDLTAGVNNTVARLAASGQIGTIKCRRNGVELVEVSSVNPTFTLNGFNNTSSKLAGGFINATFALDGIMGPTAIWAANISDADAALWDVVSTARFGT